MRIVLLISILYGFSLLPLCSQTFSQAEVLELRKQGVYAHYQDSYVASILTGRKFTDYSNQFKQFFLGKYTAPGSLVYDGVLFEDIDLQYNVFTQELVVLLETELSERYIIVTPDKVSYFSVYGHEFVQLAGDSVMEKGIYELAYGGVQSKVFVKHSYLQKEIIEGGAIDHIYEPKKKYFITNEFGTFRISGKKKLLEAYRESPRLRAILKSQRIRFSKNNIEQGLVTAVSQLEIQSGMKAL